MPQEFLWSFRRAGEVKFMKAPFLSSLLPWIVHRRDWKDLRQALSPLWSYSPWEGRVFSYVERMQSIQNEKKGGAAALRAEGGGRRLQK